MVPDVKQVVVATTRQLRSAGGPLQPANFLRVRRQGGRAVVADAHVVHHDVVVPGAGGQAGAVPRKRPDPRGVPAKRTHLFQARDVPDLHLRRVRANRDVLPIRSLMTMGRDDNRSVTELSRIDD